MIDPRNIFALIVGIEKYDVGSRWTLPGPASDAVRFAVWLRRHEVPETNIRVYMDFEGAAVETDLTAELAEWDLEVKGRAREQDILPFIRNELRTWKADLLYVFWGGHGVNAGDHRRLFFSNLTEGLGENIDIENCQAALRSNLYPGLLNQVWYIDACASDYESQYSYTRSIGGNTLPSDIRRIATKQLSFFAAAAGQAAYNDGAKRAGKFSEALLQCIDHRPVSDAFPPDHHAVIAGVKAKLVDSGQQPVTLEWWTELGEHRSFDLGSPSNSGNGAVPPEQGHTPSYSPQHESTRRTALSGGHLSEVDFARLLDGAGLLPLDRTFVEFLTDLNRDQPTICEALLNYAGRSGLSDEMKHQIEAACYGKLKPLVVLLSPDTFVDLLPLFSNLLASSWSTLGASAFRHLVPQQGPRMDRAFGVRRTSDGLDFEVWPRHEYHADVRQQRLHVATGDITTFGYSPNGRAYWPHFEVSVSAAQTGKISITERGRSTTIDALLQEQE
jgi:hypothetical protein